ncbi:right-handed parallel beta-helix repeat-containing protein [Candidatus Acetothermia bacterium]|nr:right-handed parallel beta-helix repeat-containing protein [Candidatus Acetothermia bacterium]
MLKFIPIYRVALFVIALSLLTGIAPTMQAQTESECTMNFGAGAALQFVLNNAPEGAVICLSRGFYFGPLLLAKSITLRGVPADAQGRLATVFRPVESTQTGRPVFVVQGPNEMTVNLENLSIVDSKDFYGLIITHGKIVVNLKNSEIVHQGNSGVIIDGGSQLNVSNSRIADNLVYGILMLGSSQVTLTDSVVSGNKAGGVLAIEASSLALINSQLKENDPYGAAMNGTSHATIQQSTISENTEIGLAVNELSSALIEDSKIAGNGHAGLVAGGNAEVKINRTEISNHGEIGLVVNESAGVSVTESKISRNRQLGLLVQGTGELQLTDTQVIDNMQTDPTSQRRFSVGIVLNGSSVATLTRATITGNGFYGIALLESSQAEVTSSEINQNGADPVCVNVQAVCTGVLLGAKSQLKMTDSRVANNVDWGVAAFLKKCGFNEDTFTGIINFQGSNTFQGNNQSGKHQGEVCLP